MELSQNAILSKSATDPLFNSGRGSGSFYQGGDGRKDDQKEREPSITYPPIDPQTIELIDISSVK